MGRTQRTMCAGMLGLQSVVLLLTAPVLAFVNDVGTGTAFAVGGGLAVACVAAAGLMRRPAGLWLGWGIQVVALALGFVIPVMFALGAVFVALLGGSFVLGRTIDRERAARESASAGG